VEGSPFARLLTFGQKNERRDQMAPIMGWHGRNRERASLSPQDEGLIPCEALPPWFEVHT
jgi:hypothetical protein